MATNTPTTPDVVGTIPLRERRSIAEEYAEFAAAVLPSAAGEVQRTETRRAYYAGAASMFALMTGGLDKDHEPTELDVAYIQSLYEEIVAFSQALADGTA